MARSKSSAGWLKEHFDDYYVNKAKQDGFRSRAVYKLQEIDGKDNLFYQGMTVVDLGAAPGSWTQWVASKVGGLGRVFALDILPVEPFAGVIFIQGDFRKEEVYQSLVDSIGNTDVDLVISDMAPNMTGNKGIDIPKAMYLVELSIDLADQVLRGGGDLLVKVFQGEGYDHLLKGLKKKYNKVIIRKPKASRARSREFYVLARGKK